MNGLPLRHSTAVHVNTTAERLFEYLDDPARIGGHMEERSWRTAGMRMHYELDGDRGKAIGSRIKLGGRIFGYALYAEQVVVQRQPPELKAWATVGATRLLVI